MRTIGTPKRVCTSSSSRLTRSRSRVERRQRLVQQQQLRLADQRASQGHALPLATRQVAWQAARQRCNLELLQELPHLFWRIALPAAPLQPEGDILLHRQMGKQRVILKQIADVAHLGRQIDAGGGVVEHPLAHLAAAGVGPQQAGDALQRHALARARWAEHQRAVVLGLERELQAELAALGAQRLANVDADSHRLSASA
jgi:hypothetical protein